MKKASVYLILFGLVLSVRSLLANDGAFYVSDNQLIPTVETEIAVAKEVLTISKKEFLLTKASIR